LSLRQPDPQPSSIFHATEPVIGTHPLLPDAQVPVFGDTAEWNLNGVIRRPAQLWAAGWKLVFSHELVEPTWNLLARELSMVMLNPRHPAVIAAGLSLKPRPANPSTVINELSHLRRLASWAQANQLAPQLETWQDNDLRHLIRDLRDQLSASSIRRYIGTLKMLHRYGPAFTGRGLRSDPWTGKSTREAAQLSPAAVVSTPVIPPQQWFPLIKAAWTYVHTFAPDILRAQHRCQELFGEATAMTPDRDTRLERWLADPTNLIPVHTDPNDHGKVNWGLLTLLLGWKQSCQQHFSVRTAQRASAAEHASKPPSRPGTRPRRA
jgi:hypothetical protein